MAEILFGTFFSAQHLYVLSTKLDTVPNWDFRQIPRGTGEQCYFFVIRFTRSYRKKICHSFAWVPIYPSCLGESKLEVNHLSKTLVCFGELEPQTDYMTPFYSSSEVDHLIKYCHASQPRMQAFGIHFLACIRFEGLNRPCKDQPEGICLNIKKIGIENIL